MYKLLMFTTCVLIGAKAALSVKPVDEEVELHRARMLRNRIEDSGPLSKQMKTNHTTVIFLGAFNGKYIYYDMTPRTQDAARAGCQLMGMKLLRVDRVDEMEFINNGTTGYDYIWTDGTLNEVQSSFRWAHSGRVNVPDAIVRSPFTGEIGLALEKNPTRFCIRPANQQRHSLCYI
ncbi:uncharacterized protein LOC110855042 [Folsomia candida]|uniref:Killer cell lectin-like receptor 7 n=1 Tax=Folsomia candida TaxID=158441 RepID=A0A226DSX8_FOLCA|nr:uncharacterized protein LOC110855042 [Folsomia candida]OXA48595.1 Killer cell lectin-like receptor 7 [Folsomia candida]